MDRINALANPLFPASANSWEFMMEMFSLMQNMAKIMPGNYILSGCNESGGNVSDGIVVVSGEILPFVGGVKTSDVIITETNSSVLDNGVTYPNVYTRRSVSFGSGSGSIAWSTFVRGVKRNYAQQNIITSGSHTISNTVGYIKVLVGSVTINMPTASEENKGNVIRVFVDVTTSYVTIIHGATTLFTYGDTNPYKYLLQFQSNGSNWFKIDDIPNANEDYKGLAIYASESDFDNASDSFLAVRPSLIRQRKPFRGYVTKTQDTSIYSIPSTTDVIHINYVDDYQDVDLPLASSHKNRIISLYGLHNIINTHDYNIYPEESWSEALTFEFSCWMSTGQRWILLAHKSAYACPFLYINGIKSGEVLRNLLDKKRKVEETTDITEFLHEGKNRIIIKEEKEEVSFFDSIKIVVNGKTIKSFAKKEILNKGESISEVIDISFDDKVEIIAKGYYELSENKMKELWFGEPGMYDDKGKLIKT